MNSLSELVEAVGGSHVHSFKVLLLLVLVVNFRDEYSVHTAGTLC